MHFVKVSLRAMAGLAAASVLVLPAAANAAAVPPGWETYSDAALGFAISYPKGWKIRPSDFGDAEKSFKGIAIEYPDPPGTEAVHPSVTLFVGYTEPSEGCTAEGFATASGDQSASNVVNEPLHKVTDYAGPSGNDFSEETIDVKTGTSPCIAVVSEISWMDYSDPPADHLDPALRAKLAPLLAQISATFTTIPKTATSR